MSAVSDNGDIQDRATGVFFAVTLGAAALSLGAGLYAWHRSQNATAAPEQTPQTTEAARNTRKVLQYFLIPLWTAAALPTGSVIAPRKSNGPPASRKPHSIS